MYAAIVMIIGFLVASATAQDPTHDAYTKSVALENYCSVTTAKGNIRVSSINQTCFLRMVVVGTPSDEYKSCSELVQDFVRDYKVLALYDLIYNNTVVQNLSPRNATEPFALLLRQTGDTLDATAKLVKKFVEYKGATVPSVAVIRQNSASYIDCYTRNARETFAGLWKESEELVIRFSRYTDNCINL